jgi:hypothetical protein
MWVHVWVHFFLYRCAGWTECVCDSDCECAGGATSAEKKTPQRKESGQQTKHLNVGRLSEPREKGMLVLAVRRQRDGHHGPAVGRIVLHLSPEA